VDVIEGAYLRCSGDKPEDHESVREVESVGGEVIALFCGCCRKRWVLRECSQCGDTFPLPVDGRVRKCDSCSGKVRK
jgi:hypothetical protein